MAEFEAHNLATPGDVLVIDGVSGMSNMGGISAQTGKRQGEVGAIVWGGVRDVGHSRSVDYPIWSTELSAVTGKWRLQTIEINGPVEIGGVRVEPGDLVDRGRDQRVLRAARAHDRCARAGAAKGRGRGRPLQGDRRRHPGAGYFQGDVWGRRERERRSAEFRTLAAIDARPACEIGRHRLVGCAHERNRLLAAG